MEAIIAVKKVEHIVSGELEGNGWSGDPDKDEKINFEIQGEAKWGEITFTHDLSWKKHCKR